MKNEEAIRRRLDEIEKMTSYTEALVALSTITFDIGMDACEERTIMRRDVERMRKIIEGNGDHTHSIVYRLSRVESSLSDVAGNVKEIRDKLVGTLEKGGVISNCNERFERLEEVRDGIKKVGWFVGLAVLGQVVITLIGLVGG